ncbi:MAG: DUF5615 family PIN-like protein [Halobacteriota archaeon]
MDECAGEKPATLLKDAGYDTIFVGDWNPSVSDEAVLKKAEEEGRILITDDTDFGELIFRLKRPSEGVILIRTSTTDSLERFKSLENIIKSSSIEKKFIVIKDKFIRVREI